MKKKAPVTPPVMKQYAHLWTMVDQPSAAKEWTPEEKVKRIKAAGFAGAAWRPLLNVGELCQEHGLDYVCYIDADATNYKERLQAAKSKNPARVNVQVCDHDTPPAQAVKVWLKLEKLAEEMGLNVDLEVHRDTATETPEKTYEIAALYKKATGKKIRFCWDFSHLAVIKHILPPFAERLLLRPDLIQLARQMHFRPFNGQHCQVAVTDGKGKLTYEVKNYLAFVEALVALWLKGAKGGEVLYVCPELGPVAPLGYGLTSFPNVWEDAQVLRKEIDKIWNAQIKIWKQAHA